MTGDHSGFKDNVRTFLPRWPTKENTEEQVGLKIFREHEVKTLMGFISDTVFGMYLSPFLIFSPPETG